MLKDLLEHRHEVEEEVGDLGKVVEVGQDETASTSAVAPDEKSGGVRVAVNEVEGVEPESGWANEGTTPPLSSKAEGKRKVRRRAHASYELSGTSDSPQPRIRIIFSSASSNSGSSSSSDPEDPRSHVLSRHPSANSDETDPSPVASTRFEEVSSESESNEQPGGADMRREISADSLSSAGSVEVFEGAGPKEMHLLKRMYGIHVPGHRESGESEEEAERDQKWLGMDPVTTKVRHFTEELNERKSHSRRNSDETVKWVAGGLKNCAPGHCEGPKCYEEGVHPVEDKTGVDAGGEADDEDESTHTSDAPKVRRRHHHHRTHRREVFIPLNIDSEFLTLLAQALNSLAILQTAQKTTFASSVALLAREVSLVSSPSRPRSDLYIWREIFSLWVEAQIFESERERDRGERTVEDAELKLGWFVDQVAVRGLAKKMRHKESRVALEKFIKLNVELLDMKRFQMANEEAARKIVGPSDKERRARTDWIAAQEARQADGVDRLAGIPPVHRSCVLPLGRSFCLRRGQLRLPNRDRLPRATSPRLSIAAPYPPRYLHQHTSSHHPFVGGLRMHHLRRRRIQANQTRMRTQVLRALSSQDAEAGTGRLSPMSECSRAPRQWQYVPPLDRTRS